jgi:2-dehydro-3-deoxygluconokinase
VTGTIDVLGIGEPMALFEATDPGPLEQADSFTRRLAGAEVNLLIGVARLGHRPALLSAVGDDPFGRFVLRTLSEQGVGTQHVRVDPRRATGVFFKEVTGEDRRRVFYYRDGSAASALGSDALEDLTSIQPRVLVVSGLTLGLGGSAGLGAVAADALARARALGTTTVFDANLRPTLWDGDRARAQFADLAPHLDIVLAGREELESLCPGRSIPEVSAQLRDGGCTGLVVKDGARGSVVVDERGTCRVPPLPVTTIDPVGAGDAFGAGIVTGVLRGWDLREAARLGSVLGSAVVGSRGDWEGLPGPDRARELLEQLAPVEVLG